MIDVVCVRVVPESDCSDVEVEVDVASSVVRLVMDSSSDV